MVQAVKLGPRSSKTGGAPRTTNRAWAGRGSGARCDLCHQVIDEDQVEYEVELSEMRDRTLTLHLECYERWTMAREVFDDFDRI
ncbi:MAG TPA: hypothetical protein VN730_11185 [Steroidobacteraceae bacterium]|nr:hypothetical protein [Steroidobacteraceae bacterium]